MEGKGTTYVYNNNKLRKQKVYEPPSSFKPDIWHKNKSWDHIGLSQTMWQQSAQWCTENPWSAQYMSKICVC